MKVAPGFQTSAMALATLRAPSVLRALSVTLRAPSVNKKSLTIKGKSFENLGRKVRKKWWPSTKKLAVTFFFRPIVQLRFILASTKLWSL